MPYSLPSQPRHYNPDAHPHPGEELPALSPPNRNPVSINNYNSIPPIHFPSAQPIPITQSPSVGAEGAHHHRAHESQESYYRPPSILSPLRSPPTAPRHTCGRSLASPEPQNRHRSIIGSPPPQHHHQHQPNRHRRQSVAFDIGSEEHRHRPHSHHDEDHHSHPNHHSHRHTRTSHHDDMMRPPLPRNRSSDHIDPHYHRKAGNRTPEPAGDSYYQPGQGHPMSMPNQSSISHNYGPFPGQLDRSMAPTMAPAPMPGQSHAYGPMPIQLQQSMAPTMGPGLMGPASGGDPMAMSQIPAQDYTTFAAISGQNLRALPYASPHYPGGPGGHVGYPNAMPLSSTIDLPPPPGKSFFFSIFFDSLSSNGTERVLLLLSRTLRCTQASFVREARSVSFYTCDMTKKSRLTIVLVARLSSILFFGRKGGRPLFIAGSCTSASGCGYSSMRRLFQHVRSAMSLPILLYTNGGKKGFIGSQMKTFVAYRNIYLRMSVK